MPAFNLNLRTTGASLLLVLVLGAYTLQTELASFVQSELGYQKPYFLFWVTHSGYILLFPLHLVALRFLGVPLAPALSDVLSILASKYAPSSALLPTSPNRRSGFHHASLDGFSVANLKDAPWIRELAKRVAVLTVFISAPALSWYGAVPLTNMTDITAIYNVFAFWAYLLSLYYLPPPAAPSSSSSKNPSLLSRLNPLDLLSVLLAVLGVFIIAYGPGSGSGSAGEKEGSNRLLGNSLALFGSVAYAGYEVYYKLVIALPSPTVDETPLRTLSRSTTRDESAPLTAGREGADDGDDTVSETASLLASPTRSPPRSASPSPSSSSSSPSPPDLTPTTPPPQTTPTAFLLYSTTLTSLIGLCTFLFLWLPLPLLHLAGWETFEPPPRTLGMYAALAGIVGGGVVFNGGFMVLLSLWGPVIASVSNLLTLLLVALADQLFMPSPPPLTSSTLLGGLCIVGAFGGLIWGEVRGHEREGRGAGGGDQTRKAVGGGEV
ncbi:hypothetical protein JCM6882_003612 [Rhodosporidiobolus microsporus]